MKTTIQKVLIANRGEISCRVSRTCHTMGIQTVAVCCDAETNARHVIAADEAFRVGPPPAKTSYLRADKIIEVAKKSGATAIHPGYGFLSENADFAEEVAKAGLEFIGPPASAIRAMGSKSESKILMKAADVPVLEGYNGEEGQSNEVLVREAARIGYPVLIKAIMGGGGKGMKLANSPEEFLPQLESARREAMNFFKDDSVILERYVTTPRHVEVQVMCDKHGNGLYFFERDCSVQRRHQKVLEECPGPGLPREIARKMGDVAVRAAKAVKYVGAGTVEFIYDAARDQYFFMEMNTRLQVEHPVTEEAVRVRGEPLDLVRLMLLVAMGYPLPYTQDDVTIEGHAIEARVYAESPREGFLPGSGHLTFVEEPKERVLSGHSKIRVDTGFRSGDDVLVHYDPMIAKVIAWGKDRATALDSLMAALREYHVIGIPTNINFLQHCLANSQFRAGGVTTKFIEDNKLDLLKQSAVNYTTVALAAVALVRGVNPFFLSSFRLNRNRTRTIRLQDAEDKSLNHTVAVECGNNNTFAEYKVTLGNVVTTVRLLSEDVAIVNDSERISFRTIRDAASNTLAILSGGGSRPTGLFLVPPESLEGSTLGESAGGATEKGKRVKSPLNGKVVKVVVPPGTTVKKGDVLIILEAMKMEHNVKSERDGVLQKIGCKEGAMVSADSILAEVS